MQQKRVIMNLFHKEPSFIWNGHKVRIRIAVGDSETFYEGILKTSYADGYLISTGKVEVFIPQESVVAIEREIP